MQLSIELCDNVCLCRAGYIDVYVGGQQPNQTTTVNSNVLHGEVNVVPSHSQWSDRLDRMRVEKWQNSFEYDHDTPVEL